MNDKIYKLFTFTNSYSWVKMLGGTDTGNNSNALDCDITIGYIESGKAKAKGTKPTGMTLKLSADGKTVYGSASRGTSIHSAFLAHGVKILLEKVETYPDGATDLTVEHYS